MSNDNGLTIQRRTLIGYAYYNIISYLLIYLCEAADMRNVFAQINENIESVNCRYFSVAQCATLQTTLQKGILSTKKISSFVDG